MNPENQKYQKKMTAWIATLKVSAWCFGVSAALVLLLWLEGEFEWGWSTAGNWGYFLLWMIVGAVAMFISVVLAFTSAIALLVLKSRREHEERA